MEQIIPFKKKIDFKTNVNSISSLTLEHDYKVLENMISGTFIVSGTYRATEASLIDEDFFYKLPFEIGISDRIKGETVNLKIDDFDYELTNNDGITLNINLILDCEENEDEIIMKESNFDDLLKDLDLDEEHKVTEVEEDVEVIQDQKEDMEEETLEEDVDLKEEPDERKDTFIQSESESVNLKTTKSVVSKEEVANSISGFVSENKNYVTYKVYIVHEFEDFNAISTKFNVPLKVLAEYNEIKDLNVGDKVIIPYVFE